MSDILCAELLSGCEGTGFWPGDPTTIVAIAGLTIALAVAVFVYRYFTIRKGMDE